MTHSRRVIPIKPVELRGPQSKEAMLLRDGWQRKTVIGEPRLSELVENYKAMGYDVHVVLFEEQNGDCNSCFEAASQQGQQFGTVYVRRGGKPAADDELF